VSIRAIEGEGRAMQRDQVLTICAGKTGASEDYPFGDGVAVFKVVGKMFALVSLDDHIGQVSLKCDPELALALRTLHPAVTPGYHLNKRHWHSVTLDGSIDEELLAEMIDDSYDLVVGKLPKAVRERLLAR